jgi:hypothetical protein
MRINTLSARRRIPRRAGYATVPTVGRRFGAYPWHYNGGDLVIELVGLKKQDYQVVLTEPEVKKLAEFITRQWTEED